jgi:ATP-binding cassette subfamily F protein 3
MVNKIVELYQQELHSYSGNYDFYEKEKAIRMELQQKAFENQQDYIRQQERIVERFRAKASKATMAQSIIKKLDKLERIDAAELIRPNIKINFRIDKTPGKVLVELKGIAKSFGNNCILKNGVAEIERGDKIALIGANGKGKSTLLRIIAGTEPFDGGERKWGHNVSESFYAQHQLESLRLSNTILDEMKECGSQLNDLELRGLLGCFLFSGDDADKRISVLSGGEKARVALAKVIVSKANFLMLDEPTNHLDLHSCELLIEALNNYQGTLMLVSHDRHFIAKTANKIWEIVDQEIKEFKGGYEEWVAWKERMARQKANEPSVAAVAPVVKPTEITAPKNQQTNGAVDKEKKKELQKLQKRFEQVESSLAGWQTKKGELEKKLSDPGIYATKDLFLKTESDFSHAMQQIESLNKEYEQLFEKIMNASDGN